MRAPGMAGAVGRAARRTLVSVAMYSDFSEYDLPGLGGDPGLDRKGNAAFGFEQQQSTLEHVYPRGRNFFFYELCLIDLLSSGSHSL